MVVTGAGRFKMEIKKIKINGKEYDSDDYLTNHLVETGNLEKRGDEYFWIAENIQRHIKSARHIVRYGRNPIYRMLVNFYRSLTK